MYPTLSKDEGPLFISLQVTLNQDHSSTRLLCCLPLSFTSSPSFPSSLAHQSPCLLFFVSCCCLLMADSGGVNSSKCLLDLVFRIEPLSHSTPCTCLITGKETLHIHITISLIWTWISWYAKHQWESCSEAQGTILMICLLLTCMCCSTKGRCVASISKWKCGNQEILRETICLGMWEYPVHIVAVPADAGKTQDKTLYT